MQAIANSDGKILKRERQEKLTCQNNQHMIKLLKKCNYSVQNRSASQYQCGKHYLPTLSKECLSKIKKPCRLVHSD